MIGEKNNKKDLYLRLVEGGICRILLVTIPRLALGQSCRYLANSISCRPSHHIVRLLKARSLYPSYDYIEQGELHRRQGQNCREEEKELLTVEVLGLVLLYFFYSKVDKTLDV